MWRATKMDKIFLGKKGKEGKADGWVSWYHSFRSPGATQSSFRMEGQ